PILIRLKYQIELLDHNLVVAEKHKLILSVCVILDILESKYGHADIIIYLGLMFIRICSDKYDSSTTYSYRKNFDDLMSKEQLCNYITTIDKQSKPVVVLLSDSDLNENS
ncbi:17607_t:CDS:1, partial [Racocetra persica]